MDGFSAPFGEMLKAFRQRKNMTQQHLASKLAVHRNTIGGWERGDYLPESGGMVLELARHLLLGDQETRQLLEASLTAISPYWSVPYQRNLFFTGRATLLDTLHQMLSGDRAIALTQSCALHGLGGIGKTQIALEYAYRYALEYGAVFWIEAETAESIVASFARIADHLQHPERNATDQQRIVTAMQHWLATHGKWLVIWDNLEDLALLQQFLPATHQGTILLTTRLQTFGTLASGLELLPMTLEEGMLFLLRRARLLQGETTSEEFARRFPAEWSAAEDLVRVMGGLPLALDQAGAYLEETGCRVKDYLHHYDKQCAELLDRRGTREKHHPHSVTTTFSLAYEKVKQKNPLAADFLHLCAFLAAENIPEELFSAQASQLASECDPMVADPFVAASGNEDLLVMDTYQFDLLIATLRNFSLVKRESETRTLSLHRLVQVVLQESMNAQERADWQQRAIRQLNALFPEVAYPVWNQCERLLPHVLACLATLPDDAYSEDLAHLLQKAASYLREREQHEAGAVLFQRALSILERHVEAEHPLVVRVLHGLALLYNRQGKYEQARPLYERALSLREKIYGPDHPLVAQSSNVLGVYFAERGQYQEAIALFQRALRIREQALGPDHPLVTSPVTNLAELFYRQQNYEQAEKFFQRSLSILTKTLQPDHPSLWDPLHGLANIARERGEYAQAEVLYQRSLRQLRPTENPDDPFLAMPLTGLATLYFRQGEYEQAEGLYQQALAIQEKSLGSQHAEVAYTLNGLATLYCEQSRYEEAWDLYKQILTIREQLLGSQHPETAQTLHDLAVCAQKQGRLTEAASLYERALAIRSRSLNESHPQTSATPACLQSEN